MASNRPPAERRQVLIVDGYNVLRSSGAYRDVAPDDYSGGTGLNAARSKLVADVATFAQRRYEATIVFDGGGNPESTGEGRRNSGVKVIYSPAGVDADAVIERLVAKARSQGADVLVVTSDEATQWTVLGDAVTRMSAIAFAQEVETVNASWRERNPDPIMKTTLGERVGSDVYEKLARMARGEEL